MFPGSSDGKESDCNVGDPSSIPGSGRSHGEGNGNPLQYSWASLVAQLVKNPPQCRKPWFDPWVGMIPPWEGKGCPLQCSGLESSMDCIVTKSQTQLSNFQVLLTYFRNEGTAALGRRWEGETRARGARVQGTFGA